MAFFCVRDKVVFARLATSRRWALGLQIHDIEPTGDGDGDFAGDDDGDDGGDDGLWL